MFKDEDTSLLVREDMLNICLLLTRSYVKVVHPSCCSDQEKEQFKRAIDDTFKVIESQILAPIYQIHPELKTESVQASKMLGQVDL